MDKMTKQYIDQAVKPLLSRIETLEQHNEELRQRVKYLQSVVNHERGYQKMTVASSNHMRDSRLSSKDSEIHKRPNWNSKTKIDHSPAKVDTPTSHEKVKTKPPIPKIVKSPAKHCTQDLKPSSDKKIMGGTKIPRKDNRVIEPSPEKQKNEKTVTKEVEDKQNQKRKEQKKLMNNKFEELVRHNNQIISSMKKGGDYLQPGNLVANTNSPRSQYHQSPTTSLNSCSFVSENPAKA